MAFTPTTSLPSGGGGGGVVQQGARDATVQAWYVDNPPADVLDVNIASPSPLPVSGPLTDLELRASPVPVTISGTVPVSVESLPLPAGAASDELLGELLAQLVGSAQTLALLTSAALDTDADDLVMGSA